MTRLVAFLRAINVGGHTVTMKRLREIFEELGATEVETFIASGNVIFTPRSSDIGALERTIAARLTGTLGYEVATFIRTEAEVAAIARCKPFTASQVRSAKAINVAFLSTEPDAATRRSVMALKTDIDDFRVRGREVYWLCRRRQSESRFSYAALEKTLKARATFRGVNTIVKLAEKCGRPGLPDRYLCSGLSALPLALGVPM